MQVNASRPVFVCKHCRLVNELYSVWANPDPHEVDPVVIEDHGEVNGRRRIHVIWSKWENVDHIERSEIIMDAAEMKLSTQDLLATCYAMGLTPDEAKRMGIGS